MFLHINHNHISLKVTRGSTHVVLVQFERSVDSLVAFRLEQNSFVHFFDMAKVEATDAFLQQVFRKYVISSSS